MGTTSNAQGRQFAFWLRYNYFAAEMDYQLNAGADADRSQEKNARRVDDFAQTGPSLHRLGALGKSRSIRGTNALALKIHSKLSDHGGIDCMVFTNTGFVPSGAVKPGVEETAGWTRGSR